MSNDPHWLTDIADSIFGGTVTTMAGAFIGRLMWHAREVKAGKRRFLSIELLWDIPVAVGMALIAEGLASYFDLGRPATTGLVAMAAYLGPRGFEIWVERIIRVRSGSDK